MAHEKSNENPKEKADDKAVVVKGPATSPEMSRDDFGRWMERVFEWPDRFGLRSDWIERFMRDMPGRFWPERLGPAFESLERELRVEEQLKDDELVIKVEMPGLDPDKDVDIQVADGRLHISAERRSEAKEEDKGRVRSEFRYGSFRRSLPMPAATKAEDIKATYRDGVLELRVPVSTEKAATTRVPVSRA